METSTIVAVDHEDESPLDRWRILADLKPAALRGLMTGDDVRPPRLELALIPEAGLLPTAPISQRAMTGDDLRPHPLKLGPAPETEGVLLGASSRLNAVLRRWFFGIRNEWDIGTPRCILRVVVTEQPLGEFDEWIAEHIGSEGREAVATGSSQRRGGPSRRIEEGRARHPGLRAVDDLRRWFSLRVEDVAAMTGLSPSTVYYWADHPDSTPRAAKLASLLRLHALAEALIEEIGLLQTRRWFMQHRDLLLAEGPEALQSVEDLGYDILDRRALTAFQEAGPGRPLTREEQLRELEEFARGEGTAMEPLRATEATEVEADELQ